jgi:CubicO group peptidase (beta-lactamase class C family)
MRISDRGVAALKARAQADIDSGAVPSCQYALALDGEVVVSETLGEAPSDARFAIWSATKPVFASVVWQLMGEGALDPAAPVVEHWPEFGAHGKSSITLEHLLLFTAGIPEQVLAPETVGDRELRARQIEEWQLEWEPGSRWAYHPVSAHWVMAELVDRVAGGDHRVALRQRVLDPLGLDRLELGVPEDRQGDVQRIVAGGTPATSEEIAQFLGLPSIPAELQPMLAAAAGGPATAPNVSLDALLTPTALAAGVPGGGAVGDAPSLALFYQALLNDTKGVWHPDVLRDVTSNVRNTLAGELLGIKAMRTLGLEVQGDDPTARFRSGGGVVSPRTFGHGGALGQVAWADPETGLSFAYLTNGNDINAVRQNRRSREVSAAAIACLSA